MKCISTIIISLALAVIDGMTMYYTGLQVKVTKAQNIPIYKVERDFIHEGNKAKQETITIRNVGSAASGFKANVQSFICVEYPYEKTPTREYFLISNYFDFKHETHDPKDIAFLAFNWESTLNRRMVESAMNNYVQLLKDKGIIVNKQILHYIDIQYVDMFNEKHSEIHLIDDWGRKKISNPESDSELKKRKEILMKSPEIDLWSLSAEKLTQLSLENKAKEILK